MSVRSFFVSLTNFERRAKFGTDEFKARVVVCSMNTPDPNTDPYAKFLDAHLGAGPFGLKFRERQIEFYKSD